MLFAMGADKPQAPAAANGAAMSRNLRHFRVFLAVAELRSPTLAAERCRVSQPAVTQSLGKLEREAGGDLFERTRQGFYLNERGRIFEARLRRAMRRLDAALGEITPQLRVTATTAQLEALIAMNEAQNISLAARKLGLAQPTVQRAIAKFERVAARPLFERTSFGMVATRACRKLAQAAGLAFAEIDQAEAELAELDGHETGRVVIGSLPLSRSVVLPEALVRFRAARPSQQVTIVDGPYGEMLGSLRRGSIDFIIGALRGPLPICDVIQEPLFDDHLTIVARPGHPLDGRRGITFDQLVPHAWAVPRPGTPSRDQFDSLFRDRGLPQPRSLLEVGSILLMRELLARSDMLGCISGHQAEAEISKGLLVTLHTKIDWPARAIGLTYRSGWVPTRAQGDLLDHVRDVSRQAARSRLLRQIARPTPRIYTPDENLM